MGGDASPKPSHLWHARRPPQFRKQRPCDPGHGTDDHVKQGVSAGLPGREGHVMDASQSAVLHDDIEYDRLPPAWSPHRPSSSARLTQLGQSSRTPLLHSVLKSNFSTRGRITLLASEEIIVRRCTLLSMVTPLQW
ncbi:hypothetical protein GWK47_033409 [Chionoecetes opilio]|uniref:Uncharacterized protein n=1 Tax=Chionoecetes opilio TaxID=41210 RepID=A0A8J4YS11_CHIOP|nr:hypothetical protein GWK47_033409 [Chionoecetes opilio]